MIDLLNPSNLGWSHLRCDVGACRIADKPGEREDDDRKGEEDWDRANEAMNDIPQKRGQIRLPTLGGTSPACEPFEFRVDNLPVLHDEFVI